MPYPSFELSSGNSRAKTCRRSCAWTGGFLRQFAVELTQPGRRAGWKVRDPQLVILPIRWFGLRSQHPPEDDERSRDQRELRRPEQQQAGDLLVLYRAIRLIEEMVRERQRDPRDGWRDAGHHQVADLGDRRQPARPHNRPPEENRAGHERG